jgi:hypothetical protein
LDIWGDLVVRAEVDRAVPSCPVGRLLVATGAEEALEPELGDLVMPADRVEHVDQLTRRGQSNLADPRRCTGSLPVG